MRENFKHLSVSEALVCICIAMLAAAIAIQPALKLYACFLSWAYWLLAIYPHLKQDNAIQSILVRFRTLWKHYRTVTIIITMLLVIFVWCLARL